MITSVLLTAITLDLLSLAFMYFVRKKKKSKWFYYIHNMIKRAVKPTKVKKKYEFPKYIKEYIEERNKCISQKYYNGGEIKWI